MTKADQWRAKAREVAAEEAVELPLPSGMTVRARRPGAALLAGWGGLPMHLTSHVMERGDGEPRGEVVAYAQFVRDLLVHCVVEPRISLTPASDEIHPREVPDPDLQYILAWALRREEAASLETFRAVRANVGNRGGGEDVEGASVPVAGDLGPRGGARSGSRGHRDLASTEG